MGFLNAVRSFIVVFNYFCMAFTILLLLLGVNVGVKYFFMSIKRTHEIEELEKKTLEQQLEYLKYQINPHFFMNTLNNIHALVDVNPDKAKSSILELSKLMRYVLYESNNPSVPLQRELEFIRHYIELMRMRYTEKVEIDVNLPADCSSRPIPPLMFISFVENAFKHGVSYVQSSKIKISVEEDEHKVKFMCSNTKASSNGEQGGIGMENSRKRLSLIYKEDYTLQVDEAGDTYDVLLVIPFLDDDIQINNYQDRSDTLHSHRRRAACSETDFQVYKPNARPVTGRFVPECAGSPGTTCRR